MGGYAFARVRFPFRNTLFLAYLGTLMIPFVVDSIPLFVIVARLGWQDTYQGLILPILANGAFGTFMFRSDHRQDRQRDERAAQHHDGLGGDCAPADLFAVCIRSALLC
jgi:ABC-type glycerol-3-phosphate transport system permease component